MNRRFFAVALGLMMIAACSKKGAPTADTSSEGYQVYKKSCNRCHHRAGQGGDDVADLSKSKMSHTDAVNVITYGEHRMPAFKERLSPAQIEAVTNYIFTLRK